MNILLNDVEIRVLGALMEKEATTPDYYPLSLNALMNACNQKSNRDPAMDLDEAAVREALHSLNHKGLAGAAAGADSRVTKYEHRLAEAFNFDRREAAILCVMLLRGPQTPGELRGRAERMHRFDDLSEVQSALQRLMKREPPLVKVLPRQPGNKESRYAHLLAGDVEADFEANDAPASERAAAVGSADGQRIERLESDVATLQSQVGVLRNEAGVLQREFAALKQQFADFRKQFG